MLRLTLVNTGWNGTGKRISIQDTRGIIDRILDGSIDSAETKVIPVFNLEVPTSLKDVHDDILDPRDTYRGRGRMEQKSTEISWFVHPITSRSIQIMKKENH